jgi:hypothetical protein
MLHSNQQNYQNESPTIPENFSRCQIQVCGVVFGLVRYWIRPENNQLMFCLRDVLLLVKKSLSDSEMGHEITRLKKIAWVMQKGDLSPFVWAKSSLAQKPMVMYFVSHIIVMLYLFNWKSLSLSPAYFGLDWVARSTLILKGINFSFFHFIF